MFNERSGLTITHSKWFVRDAPVTRPSCRLFCLPYAGGSASVFRGWQAALGPTVEVLAVELPGRSTRAREPAISSLTQVVDLLVGEVSARMDVPSLFFGHSNGALICYRLAVELARRGLALPQRLVLAAKEPPHRDKREILHDLPTQQFVAKLRSLNGTPSAILDDPYLLDAFLPYLRADFALSETYVHTPCPPLPCALTLLGGTVDDDTDIDDLNAWTEYFSSTPTLHLIDGDHFFIHSARHQIWRILRPLVAECAASAAAFPSTSLRPPALP